jgi:hypothetical protein
MLAHRSASLLLATGLLFSGMGCIKEPVNVTGTGSYKLDNVARRCVAQGDISFPVNMNQVYDQLSVNLLTTPEPATGPETVALTFSRLRSPQGQPVASYQLRTMTYRTAGATEVTYPVNTVTLQEDPNKFAGTFAGPSPTGATPPLLAIADGSFTELHVEP